LDWPRLIVAEAAANTNRFAATTGEAPIRNPYTTQMSAPTICTGLSAAGLQKYDPTNTAVAVHPRYSITACP